MRTGIVVFLSLVGVLIGYILWSKSFALNLPKEVVVNEKKCSSNIKVAFVIAPLNFRDEEFFVPYDYFRKHGICSNVYSLATECVGMLGMRVKNVWSVRRLIESLRRHKYTLVYFAGGSGILNVYKNPDYLEVAKLALSNSYAVAAICLAPMIIAETGQVSGKKLKVFACSPSLDLFKEKKVEYAGEGVGKTKLSNTILYTASGPKWAEKFARLLYEEVLKPMVSTGKKGR